MSVRRKILVMKNGISHIKYYTVLIRTKQRKFGPSLTFLMLQGPSTQKTTTCGVKLLCPSRTYLNKHT